MELDKQVFGEKKVGDLLQEIYEKHSKKSEELKNEISRLGEMIQGPGDAVVIMPFIKGLYDSSIKNDEALMKMVQLFKPQQDLKKQTAEDSGVLTEKDIAQLFEEVSISNKNLIDKV